MVVILGLSLKDFPEKWPAYSYLFGASNEDRQANIPRAGLATRLPRHFFPLGDLGAGAGTAGLRMVSTTWVDGLCWAVFTGTKSPVLASRPIFDIASFLRPKAIGFAPNHQNQIHAIIACSLRFIVNFPGWATIGAEQPDLPVWLFRF